ncbi:gas vesicle protein GvpO [Halobacterium salinarum]|uniref:gas vesicle protein GvpO n=1 Tax=Halobacterium salinarum TaxID=2242 RepID=UPI00255429A4|nr:gas vesicle protein GvpO [Halobacterium salinarum]MDL0132833.1 gas vesicle protein GvpO [Halobacterium salinarum]
MDDPVADQPDGTDETPDGDTAGSSPIGVADAQARAREAVAELLEHPFDGIITAESGADGGWRILAEVVERSAVPDTQDIIGRYEITLDDGGRVTGYELRERYRRGEMKEEL